jgi:murein DD-endopeptidase MepM/ murein hydrolase activator NlpD
VAVGSQSEGDALVLHVSHPARALHPGDVVLLAVEASRPLVGIEADAFGQAVRFWPNGAAGEWRALVGIGLDTRPGRYDVTVRAKGTRRMILLVEPKRFETRQLRVSQDFVNPPPSERGRIERDATLLADLFAHSGPDRLWRGPFAPPVPGAATSGFGRLTMLNGEPRARHQGVDVQAVPGTPVRAPNAGQVVLAADLYFLGHTVMLDHGSGLFSLVAHLSRIAVRVGTRAARGDLLGDTGATGRVTGPHLHWGVRLGELNVDPIALLAAVADLAEAPALVTPP